MGLSFPVILVRRHVYLLVLAGVACLLHICSFAYFELEIGLDFRRRIFRRLRKNIKMDVAKSELSELKKEYVKATEGQQKRYGLQPIHHSLIELYSKQCKFWLLEFYIYVGPSSNKMSDCSTIIR